MSLRLSFLAFAIVNAAAVAVADDNHEHHHNPHVAPLLELNETTDTPPSYWSFDFEQNDLSRYPGLMAAHIVFMCLAFFVALPMGIAMRSVKHAWHGFVLIVFWFLCGVGCSLAAIYKKLTPNMYEHSVHGSHGFAILLCALFLSIIDAIDPLRRFNKYLSSSHKFSFKSFWPTVILGRRELHKGPEYASLVVQEPDQDHMDKQEFNRRDPWVHGPNCSHSVASEGTLFGEPESPNSDTAPWFPTPVQPMSHLRRIGRAAFGTLERALVLAGFGQLLTGVVVYTGGCRQYFINGCMAHLIKGSIFWCYGLVSFARFLGSFSELGWAWNRAPSGQYPSAEFVESLVIFLYGITNTWMERFGANPGDPYTTKEVQHISIAVMFWFAGLVGMGIESRRIRRWLASSSTPALNLSNPRQELVAEPPSYISSFNPFPALVIGTTGAAMAAHTQKYLFQVQIHALWGNLLLGFSVLRCLTYFFLWLSPPRSILPSRPPTEAVGSFFLASGGLVFLFSTEEITLAAMRRGRDDVMMFLNVAVAITCFAFCWTLCIVAFKGLLRVHPSVKFHNSA